MTQSIPGPAVRRYETIAIASPNVTDDDLNQVVSSLEQVVTDGGGQVLNVDRWGKRRLAYRVKKFEEGNYFLIFHESPAPVVSELERRIRIDDRLIKFMTVLVDWEELVERAEKAREARARGMARRRAERAAAGEADVESNESDGDSSADDSSDED